MATDSIKHTHSMELTSYDNISKKGGAFQLIDFNKLSKYNIPITGIYTSNKNFSENILYSNENLSLTIISKSYPSFKNHKYAIGQLD
ncbi:MAG: hypothetical protein AB8G86_18700, partial [Saprospiraceae bacterium]